MSFNTIIDWNGCSADQQQQLLTRPAISASDSISKTVTEILNNVKANGDAALREYSAKFDKTTVAALQVSEAEIAWERNFWFLVVRATASAAPPWAKIAPPNRAMMVSKP